MQFIFGIAWVIVIGFIVKSFFDYRIQRLLIDRKMIDENLSHLFNKPEPKAPNSSIKWGLVLIGIGSGFLAREIWPGVFSDEGMAGLILVLGGVGFILHYFFTKRENNN